MQIWDVEYTDQFHQWYLTLGQEERDSVVARVELLELAGPALGRPVVDNVHRSRHANMKELRAEKGIRVLFAFDPRRTAILLIGGDKSPSESGSPDWNRWYDRYLPVADDLYDIHLNELRGEGLL
ncbi:MAG: diaminopimelate decarboxylase [Acidimicrobiales bacterium]|nr:diaminopimelate decarboxylase [Acidimicrobiales bacterium]MYH73461.1 diaminopimelate decarboxylase [Acidimicrobiales bacterium]MYK72724.1 diaminopimelate decarboxylase [Acidimicrobiales bacterium]